MSEYSSWELWEPYYWKEFNMTIIADRMEVNTGELQYMTSDTVPKGSVYNNATILMEDEPSWIKFIGEYYESK